MSIEQPVALGVPLTGMQLIEASFEARLGALRQVLLEEAHAALKERLREARLQTYDALLENNTMHSPARGARRSPPS